MISPEMYAIFKERVRVIMQSIEDPQERVAFGEAARRMLVDIADMELPEMIQYVMGMVEASNRMNRDVSREFVQDEVYS